MNYEDLPRDTSEAVQAIAEHFDVCESTAGTLWGRAAVAYAKGLEGGSYLLDCDCGHCTLVKGAFDLGVEHSHRIILHLDSSPLGYCVDCGWETEPTDTVCPQCEGKKLVRVIDIRATGPELEAWTATNEVNGGPWDRDHCTTVEWYPDLISDIEAMGALVDLTRYHIVVGKK